MCARLSAVSVPRGVLAQQTGARQVSRGGKHQTPRRFVGSQHWEALDSAALSLGDGHGVRLVSRLVEETLTDTRKAADTCRRIKRALEAAK